MLLQDHGECSDIQLVPVNTESGLDAHIPDFAVNFVDNEVSSGEYDEINPAVVNINNVLNKYFQSHLPRGVYLSNTLRQGGYRDRGFGYTQHPWLLSMNLDCPQNFTLNNVTLECPNAKEVKEMKQTIADGDLAWQGVKLFFKPH